LDASTTQEWYFVLDALFLPSEVLAVILTITRRLEPFAITLNMEARKASLLHTI
jgi:hypothetical protein